MGDFFKNIGNTFEDLWGKFKSSGVGSSVSGFFTNPKGASDAWGIVGAIVMAGLAMTFTGGGMMGMLLAIPLALGGLFIGRDWAKTGSIFGNGSGFISSASAAPAPGMDVAPAHAMAPPHRTVGRAVAPYGHGNARGQGYYPAGYQQPDYPYAPPPAYGYAPPPAYGYAPPAMYPSQIPLLAGLVGMIGMDGGGSHHRQPHHRYPVQHMGHSNHPAPQNLIMHTASPTNITRIPVETSLNLYTGSPTNITRTPVHTSMTYYQSHGRTRTVSN